MARRYTHLLINGCGRGVREKYCRQATFAKVSQGDDSYGNGTAN